MFSVSLTNPTLFSLSLSLSVVFCPTAWRIRYASSERGFEDLKTNYWIDVRQAVVSLPCFFSASALLLPSSTSFQSLSLSPLSSISAALTRRKTTCFFFFVTLRCIDCLTCQCAVQFKPSFSCIAGRSKNIDLWRPTEALYCVFLFFFVSTDSLRSLTVLYPHTLQLNYTAFIAYIACSGAKPPFAA